MFSLTAGLTLQMMILLSPLGPEQLAASLDPVLLEKAQQVDVVSVEGKFSYAEYRMVRPSPPERLGFPVHSFAPDPMPFGRFQVKKGAMVKGPGCYCGYLIPLSRTGSSLNLLGYGELVVKGRFSGTWRLAFADDVLAAAQDNVPVGKLEGAGSHRFDLTPLLKKADLSRSRQLVLLLVSESGSAAIDEVAFSHQAAAVKPKERGIWIWRRDAVLGKEERVLARLAAEGVNRAYLQVGDDPEVFAPFLKKAAAAGVEVYALDGSPSYVAAPEELLQRMERVERYSREHPEARFAGFQVDIEPYTNRDFASRKGWYAERYVRLIRELAKRFDLPLSVVVPFWFDTLHAEGRSLLQAVAESADEVVVMSYRTDPRSVLEISRSALSLGEHFGKPVRLGVEFAQIPDEQHQELLRCTSKDPGAFRLGSGWWCSSAEYLLPGSRISYRYRMEELPSLLDTAVPFASFGGWVLHSYEELPQK